MATSASPNSVLHQLLLRGLLPLADSVCERRGVTRVEICGRGRSRAVAAARHELWWLIRHHPERQYSFCEIARMLGYDHSSVIHGVAAHQRTLQTPGSTHDTCHPRELAALNQPCLLRKLEMES
jgi:hypothetical protein